MEIEKAKNEVEISGLVLDKIKNTKEKNMNKKIDEMGFGNGFEALVVVQIASAGIFDSIDTAVIMHGLVKDRCTDLLYRTPNGSSAEVQLKAIACNGYPSVRSSREMSIGFGSALDGDGRSYKFTLEIMLIQQVKNLVQIPCYTVIAGQLLHRSTPLQKNGDRATMNTVP